MFNFFRKKERVLPPFESLAAYPYKDKYFYRVASWQGKDKENILILDPNNPRVITLDPWPQIVFLAAKGKMTVQQYIEYMASTYTSKIPAALDDTIIYQINQLLEERLLRFSDVPVDLDPQHDKPRQ
ncbi:hypothetical protein [Chitinophaga niabensis]|uniref:Coenzyme PQQ synthesis protein D (PqqD) n=1 Tax=Chitinophaga niabensis TaxID=536979 RepID=A0A1N6JES4_9BACT|nr:hypothetical protein [Chitinophaga niabensis]SIO42703.1 hypothetical protein SAMN04488055_3928 [Chitinophaga niabensis]